MNKLKPILVVLLIFVAGLVVGVVGTRAITRRIVRNAFERPEGVRIMMERRLDRRLRLDADQRIKLHTILVSAHAQLATLRQDFRPKVSNVISNASQQINALLTPEQQQKFESLKGENPQFWRAGQPKDTASESPADSH